VYLALRDFGDVFDPDNLIARKIVSAVKVRAVAQSGQSCDWIVNGLGREGESAGTKREPVSVSARKQLTQERSFAALWTAGDFASGRFDQDWTIPVGGIEQHTA